MSTADTDVRVIVCLPHSVVTRQLAVAVTDPPGTGTRGVITRLAQSCPLVAASYAARAAASALPLWLIVAALAASRAAPSANARPSVTPPTEMMDEHTSSQATPSPARH